MGPESGKLYDAAGNVFDLTEFLKDLQTRGILVANLGDIPVVGTVAVEQSDPSELKATVTPTVPSALFNGQQAVASAGTAEALATTQALQRGVLVKALSTNTGLMYVGDEDVDSTNGFELEAGDMTYIEIDDLAKVYVDAAEDGEGVSYVAS